MSKTRNVLENVVIVAIVLVLIQTFLEDLATALGWSVAIRDSLLVTGFFFDLFFSVEFIVRGYDAWRHRRFGHYFWTERGWIDFLAGIPLVIFNSGPAFLALIAGGLPIAGFGGVLNVLKVVKAIRIARVLRLLRVLKVFRKIKNTDSVMAQRHVTLVSAISVSTFVFTLLVLTIAGAFLPLQSMEGEYRESLTVALDYVVAEGLTAPGSEDSLERFTNVHPGILMVTDGGSVRFSRYNQGQFDRDYGSRDYSVITRDDVTLFVDVTPVNRDQAVTGLRYFVIIVVLVLVYMFMYSPHFALTVTDPIHVMRRGMSEKNYSLEVKIPETYEDDDVYQLAREYNQVFLPMKDRDGASDSGESGGSALTLGDIDELFN